MGWPVRLSVTRNETRASAPATKPGFSPFAVGSDSIEKSTVIPSFSKLCERAARGLFIAPPLKIFGVCPAMVGADDINKQRESVAVIAVQKKLLNLFIRHRLFCYQFA
jgi:hypothetical protein